MNQITVTRRDQIYVAKFRFDFQTKDHVKAAGFKFDPKAKEWWTSDPVIAAKLCNSIRADEALTGAQAATSNAVIPAVNGLEYLPFQREGIKWLKGRENALLADEMGLGKTIQVIGLINADVSIKRVLIVCPASLKLNWKSELMTWCARPMTVSVIDPGSEWLSTDIVIINYEQVEKYRRDIDDTPWDLLVCDESHYLKSSKAKRTQVVVGYWHNDPTQRIYPIKARQRLFLTGTPVLNRPKELWTTVRALDRKNLGNDWLNFHVRYCAGYKDRFGWQIDGASNLEELNERLRASIMLRRKKSEVLPELPPKRRQVILLEPVTNEAKQALEAERELGDMAQRMEILREEVEALSVDQTDRRYKEVVQKLATYEAVAFSDTSRIRKRTALAKLPMARDHLLNVLESEQKVVVFAHHHDVIDQLVEWLDSYGVVKIDGRDDVHKRQAAVELFQSGNGVSPRVIIGSIGAMGSGWTLHAASYVAFCELDWVPGNLNQAEDRLHRIGQKESILIQHLMLNGSFDARMVKTVMHKQKVIERAVG